MFRVGERIDGWPARRKARRAAALLVAVFVPLAVAPCSSDGDTDPITVPTSTTSTALSETTTSVHSPAAAEIIDRYKEFWLARLEANQPPPNPDAPRLREYATGQQLDQVIEETRRNLAQGLALRRPDGGAGRSSVRLVKLEEDVAVLQECVVDDGVVYRYATGEVVNAAVATHSVEATMRKVGGRWKLASARLVQRWEGVAGCALSGDF
ncbi:MAG: hypothetical protein KY447_05790 [Actinobacteria bacterium]|nr:hypothetical protein [Actinomycetota bacterium]